MELLNRLRDDRGMAMLEMTIILPLLLLATFAILEMGLAFGRYQVVANAAREGARVAAIFRPACTQALVYTEVRQAVEGHGTQLGMAASDLATSLAGACSAGESTVSVTYTHDFFALPNIGSIPASVDLTGIAVMRNEV